MKMKVADMTPNELDLAVSICEGLPTRCIGGLTAEQYYSTNWEHGGPIIERERIALGPWPNDMIVVNEWLATRYTGQVQVARFGPTPLIAAMRCYITAVLGDEVDIGAGG